MAQNIRDIDELPDNQELRDVIAQRLGIMGTERKPVPFREGLYYSTHEVCERFGVSRTTIWKWRSKYGIPYFKASERSSAMYSGKDLLDFMEKIRQSRNTP